MVQHMDVLKITDPDSETEYIWFDRTHRYYHTYIYTCIIIHTYIHVYHTCIYTCIIMYTYVHIQMANRINFRIYFRRLIWSKILIIYKIYYFHQLDNTKITNSFHICRFRAFGTYIFNLNFVFPPNANIFISNQNFIRNTRDYN